jgi:CRP-like cAMP-binding protein
MRSIEDLLADVAVLSDLPAAHRALVAGCGRNVVLRDGEYLFRAGDPANTFFAVRSGSVALEIAPPARAPVMVETVHAGDVVGWSWLFEPYRARFDARAIGELHAIAFDAECLRAKIETDHDLGYELMRRFARIMTERLQATRMRLLDLYGPPRGS